MDLHDPLQRLTGKTVLLTGACGTVGTAVARLLSAAPLKALRLLDQNEQGLFELGQSLAGHDALRLLVGDVRSQERMRAATRGVDLVIHTAALKHVGLGEYNPNEVVLTNLLGLQVVIQSAIENGVQGLVYTSSDKAVNPTSVMGASKLLGERIVAAAGEFQSGSIVTCCTRFGNVLGSSGSVVPLFVSQVRRGGPVTITDPNMTRFVMTVHQAARLILESGLLARGGELFVLKMPALRIADLATVIIEEVAPRFGRAPDSIERVCIGRRPGEKVREELMTAEEAGRAAELPHRFVISPHARRGEPHADPQRLTESYVSDQAPLLGLEAIRDMLYEGGVFTDLPPVAEDTPDWPAPRLAVGF